MTKRRIPAQGVRKDCKVGLVVRLDDETFDTIRERAVKDGTGARGDRTHQFTTHAQAMAFTAKKMGRNDFVLDATTMSGEQLRQHRLHLARLRKLDDLIAERCR